MFLNSQIPNFIQRVNVYCAKVIPLVFDNSLSYYEQICNFSNKLNECIDAINAQNLDIIEFVKMMSLELEKFELYIDTSNNDYKNELTLEINTLKEEFNDIVTEWAEVKKEVLQLSNDVEVLNNRVNTAETSIERNENTINQEKLSRETEQTENNKKFTDITNSIENETLQRVSADNGIKELLNAETSSRVAEDEQIENDLIEEVDNRSREDEKLQSQINSLTVQAGGLVADNIEGTPISQLNAIDGQGAKNPVFPIGEIQRGDAKSTPVKENVYILNHLDFDNSTKLGTNLTQYKLNTNIQTGAHIFIFPKTAYNKNNNLKIKIPATKTNTYNIGIFAYSNATNNSFDENGKKPFQSWTFTSTATEQVIEINGNGFANIDENNYIAFKILIVSIDTTYETSITTALQDGFITLFQLKYVDGSNIYPVVETPSNIIESDIINISPTKNAGFWYADKEINSHVDIALMPYVFSTLLNSDYTSEITSIIPGSVIGVIYQKEGKNYIRFNFSIPSNVDGTFKLKLYYEVKYAVKK